MTENPLDGVSGSSAFDYESAALGVAFAHVRLSGAGKGSRGCLVDAFRICALTGGALVARRIGPRRVAIALFALTLVVSVASGGAPPAAAAGTNLHRGPWTLVVQGTTGPPKINVNTGFLWALPRPGAMCNDTLLALRRRVLRT